MGKILHRLTLDCNASFRVTAKDGKVTLELEDVELPDALFDSPEYLTVHDVAEIYKTPRRTVYNWLKAEGNPLPHTMPPNGKQSEIRIRRSDLDSWVERGASVAARRARNRLAS